MLDEALIDQIYEAAALPELWPGVLQRLTTLGQGEGAILFAANGSEVHWVATPEMQDGYTEYVQLGWPSRTDRPQRLFAKRHAGFLDDLDVYTPEELETEPVFVEFLRPRGIGRGVATAIPVTTGDMLVLSVERDYRRGPATRETIETLDLFRPHLARASLLSARLKLKEATAASVALEMVGLPAAILRGQHLLAPNRLLQALIPEVIVDRRDRIALADVVADRMLAQAVEQIAGAQPPSVASIAIRPTPAHPAHVLHLLPVRRAAHDIFPGASAILLVTPVIPARMPHTTLLQDLFDLTAAESRVARAIGDQQQIEEIAATFGVSRETVRTQTKSILAKTGLQRQLELAMLLAGIFVPAGGASKV